MQAKAFNSVHCGLRPPRQPNYATIQRCYPACEYRWVRNLEEVYKCDVLFCTKCIQSRQVLKAGIQFWTEILLRRNRSSAKSVGRVHVGTDGRTHAIRLIELNR